MDCSSSLFIRGLSKLSLAEFSGSRSLAPYELVQLSGVVLSFHFLHVGFFSGRMGIIECRPCPAQAAL
jgi:hypothetical protein